MDRDVCLLVNPSAGGGRAGRIAPAAQRVLRGAGLEVQLCPASDLPDARRLATSAARQGALVAVLAGDGMIGAVADALRSVEGSLLGVLPAGRGNDFARALHIPLDPIDACQAIIAGHRARIDLGAVDGRAFVGIASVGFDSLATRIANESSPRLGRLAYAYGALRALARWRPARFALQLQSADAPEHSCGERAAPWRDCSFTGYTVACASTSFYGGGMLIAPEACNRDRMLDVVTIGQMSRLSFLANLPRVFGGSHVRLSAVRIDRAVNVRIDADRPFTVYADGEPIARLPVCVSVLPAAIDVIVPAQPRGASTGARREGQVEIGLPGCSGGPR